MIYLDFEYQDRSEENFNLVCASLYNSATKETKDFWLFKESHFRVELINYLRQHEGEWLCSYNVEAEARALLSLNINPLKYKWFDLFLEYKCLSNHHDGFMYGKQIVKGKERVLKKYVTEKGEKNLVAACYKLTGEIISSEEKDTVRDIIVYGSNEDIYGNKERITKYCNSDIKYLPIMAKATINEYKKRVRNIDVKKLYEEIAWRGEYSVRTAMMSRLGHPINVDWAHNLKENVPVLLNETIEEIRHLFPGIDSFSFDKKTAKYKMNQNIIRSWIEKQCKNNRWDWELTESKMYSLSLESWMKFYPYRHEYPKDCFGAQMVRFLKIKQAVNGFVEKAGKDERNFFEYLGSDGRIRPYLNHYGAQSSRTQPSATGFMFLKPAWQRSIVQPKKGKAICGLDYSSQEFLLSALISGDKQMIAAYASGDVYLFFGKKIGLIPKHGTKETHKKERDFCKMIVLGMNYAMSKVGLAIHLSKALGRVVSEDEAQTYIDQFYDSFPDFKLWVQDNMNLYYARKHIKLADGWYMWGDNDNFRSVGNVPIQGMGACIMRKAVQLAQDKGIKVIFTLHDAIYIEYDSFDFNAITTLADCMKEASKFYFPTLQKEAALIRLEGETWSSDYEGYNQKEIYVGVNKDTPVAIESLHVDSRAKKEYEQYKKYLTSPSGLDLI